MKKSIIALILLLIPAFAFGQIFKEEATISDRAKSTARDLVGCNCPSVPITSDTKIQDVQREELDIGIRFSVLDKPESGEYQTIKVGNFDIFAAMNFNKVLYGYLWYGERSSVHEKAEGSATQPEWHYKYYGAGLGFYFTPVFKVFGGTGKVMDAENDGSVPNYGNLYEYGISYDKAVYNYKVEFTYKMVTVPIAENEIPVQDWPARASYQTFSIGVTAPFSLW